MSASGVSIREFARLAGCDEKQVRRAIEAGKLTKNADGSLDPALVSSGWRKPTKASVKSADRKKLSAPVSASAQDDETPTQAAARLVREMGAEHDLAEAIRLKENYNALLKQLEYDLKSGAVVDLEVAQGVLFDAARAARDAWLNWPAKVGPLLAADLGIEADKMTELLTAHVHAHIAELGEPEGEFSGGKG